MRTYSARLRAQPADLRLRLKLAEVCRLLGRDDEAVKLYRGVAVCHALAGNLPKAIVVCRLILDVRPYHDETQRMLARIYGSKRVREAKQAVPVRKDGAHWVAEPLSPEVSDRNTTPDSDALMMTQAMSPAHKQLLHDLAPEERQLARALGIAQEPTEPPPLQPVDYVEVPISATTDDQAVPYATLQREVQHEGNHCADHAPDDAAAASAEADLRAAFAQVATVIDTLPETVGLPRPPLFSELAPDEFVALLGRMETRTYRTGEMVVSDGDAGDSLMIVASGELNVMKQDINQRHVALAKLAPGCFFGEFGLLTDQRRYASVQCLTDSEILVLTKSVLAELTAVHPPIGVVLQQFYERRVLEMVLRTCPVFLAVQSDQRDHVAKQFQKERLDPGQVVIEQGTAGDAFYVLLVGQVEVTQTDSEGKTLLLGILSDGDYFGEMSLLSGEPAAATVRTTRLTEVLGLSSADFYAFTAEHPKVWDAVVRAANDRDAFNQQARNEHKARALLL